MRLLLGVVLVLLPAARLSAQPSVSAWDLLRHELVSPNPEHRKQAIMAIGSIGPAPEVITILNESLRDKDITIRQATAALMGELKYPGNVPNLQAALDDDSEVASQAAKSLWNMGDRSGRRVLEALYTGQERGGPNMIESAMRDAKDKLHHPKKLATMGVNEASGRAAGAVLDGHHRGRGSDEGQRSAGPRARREPACAGLRCARRAVNGVGAR